ncbi:MAG: hypothetical protein ACKPJJ_25550, partial [Planctomycetaceae bacterium]
MEISGFEITWLLGQQLGEQARQPSFRRLVLRGQRLQQLEQRQPEQQRGSMALQRPCGRGERSRDGMASAQRSCSMAWLLLCSTAWLRRLVLVRELEQL